MYVVINGTDILISYATASALGLIQMIQMVQPNKLNQLLQSHEDMFKGIGKLKGQPIKVHIGDIV